MRRSLTIAVLCALGAAGCSSSSSDGPPAAPVVPANVEPALAVSTAGAVTESPVVVTAAATDPDAANTVTCSFELLAQPRFSAVTLDAAPGDCRAGPLTASFTPAYDGAYVVRASASDGLAPPVTRTVTIDVASRYGGGVVTGTAVDPSSALTTLIAHLVTIPANGGALTAQGVYRAFANIAASGTPPAQGPALTWAQRPYDVLDVRDAADFAAGHIPGAINVPLQELPGVLLAQPYFPDPADRRRVLVVGYSQGDSSLGAILVTAGRFAEGPIPATPPNDHRAFFLSSGIATWTFDKVAAPLRWDDDLAAGRRFQWTLADPAYLESSTTSFTKAGKPTYPYPALGDFNAATTAPMKRILVRARQWAAWALADADQSGVPRHEAFVTHWGRYKALRDAGVVPQVLSAQSDAQWKVAHVVGAYRGTSTSGEYVSTTNANDLKYLDPARPVLYHCFTNTGAVSPCFQLAMLGYPARTVLYGLSGAVPPALAAAGYNAGFVSGVEDKGSGGNDFPIATATSPGPPQSLAWARPSATGCAACHADYGAHFTEVTLRPFTAPAPEVASEGEG